MAPGPNVSDLPITRRILAALFVVGSLGTAAELVLMEHIEDAWQNVPLVLIPVGCLGLAVLLVKPRTVQLRVFQVIVGLFVAAGVVGSVLHYQSNAEFELELNADAAGVQLFCESMKGAVPPLAPGTMILLGAIGFVCARLTPRESAELTSATSPEVSAPE